MKKKPIMKCKFMAVLIGISMILSFVPNIITMDTLPKNQTEMKVASSEEIKSIFWRLTRGMPGTEATMEPIPAILKEGDDPSILIGMDQGLAVITNTGALKISYITFGKVICAELIQDLDKNGEKDIIIVVYDQDHPNIIAISSETGNEIWKFKTIIKGFSSTTLDYQDFITYSWDAVVVKDINGDNIEDVIISSWYRLFAIDGATGNQIWMKNIGSDNIFYIEKIQGTGANPDTIFTGSEKGDIKSLNAQTGQILWEYTLPPRIMLGYKGSESGNFPFATSIADMQIYKSTETESQIILFVSGDDGKVIAFDVNGNILGEQYIYTITSPTDSYRDLDQSLYDIDLRLFSRTGVKIYVTEDVNQNSKADLLAIAYGIDFEYQEVKNYKGKIFDLSSTSFLDPIQGINWSSEGIGKMTPPQIKTIDSELRFYYLNPSSFQVTTKSYPSGIYYTVYDPEVTSNTQVQKVFDISESRSSSSSSSGYYYTSQNYFLISMINKTGDETNTIFGLMKNGQYFLFNLETEELLWIETNKKTESTIQQIEDINNDNIPDFLFTSVSDFNAEWYISDYINSDSFKYPKLSTEVLALNGKTSEIIWSVNLPQDGYEGVLDLQSIGDLGNDGIKDYVGWIIPSYVPTKIKEIIYANTGEIEISDSSDKIAIYQALLSNYTRMISINGSTGKIIHNYPLIESPYQFQRQTQYSGPYENPSSPKILDSTGQFYNRINDKLDLSWYAADDKEFAIPEMNLTWNPSSMATPDQIQCASGQIISGTEFDLIDTQNSNYEMTAMNNTGYIINGTTVNGSAYGTTLMNDDMTWSLNSTSNEINVEFTFDRPKSINSTLQGVALKYRGNLSTSIQQISISAYNFQSSTWDKISNTLLNTTILGEELIYPLSNINSYCNSMSSTNQTKFRIKGTNNQEFNLNIDEFVVIYNYTYSNISIMAQKSGSDYQTLINFTIPLNIDSENKLGIMEYDRSPLDRISSIKIQTSIQSNLTTQEFTLSYELFNFTSGKWISCNWNGNTYWAEGQNVFKDLYGYFNPVHRSNWTTFELTSGNYRTDSMYVMTRGIVGCDSAVEFDHQNRTTLSHFIDPDTKSLKIRVNVTNDNPYNLTIDTFGVGVFYWGIQSMKYDETGIFLFIPDLAENSIKYEGITTNLFQNLAITTFKVLNVTRDNILDIVCINEGNTETSSNPRSSTVRLFDLKQEKTFSVFSKNISIIPYSNTEIISTKDTYLLSGHIKNGDDSNFTYRLINSIEWTPRLSQFNNYTENPTSISYELPYLNLPISSSSDYFSPQLVKITKSGDLGIAIAEYSNEEGSSSSLPKWVIIKNLTSLEVISKISFDGMFLFLYSDTSNIDLLSEDQTKLMLRLSLDDFTGDGVLDHVGIFDEGSNYNHKYMLRVFDGSSTAGTPIINQHLKQIESNTFSYETYYTRKTLPFTTIGDINGDNISEIAIGRETYSYQDSYAYEKGASLLIMDVKSQTLTENVIEPYGRRNYYGDESSARYSLMDSITTVGDSNNNGYPEILITRKAYKLVTNEYGNTNYETYKITELIDLEHLSTLIRFGLVIDSLILVDDLGTDDNQDYLLSSSSIIYLVNSEFQVKFKGLTEGQVLTKSKITVTWETNADFDHFELYVDDVGYGAMIDTELDLSLGGGMRKLDIFMYEDSGLLITVDSINITFPDDPSMLVITITGSVLFIVGTIFNKKIKNKKANLILIDNPPPESSITKDAKASNGGK